MITEAERSATDRKRRVEKYFIPTPDRSQRNKAVLILVGAIVLAIIGLILLSGTVIVGLIFLAGAAYAGYKGIRKYRAYQELYSKAEPKPSGRELDAYLARDISQIEQRAMQELDLTSDDLETDHQSWDPVTALGDGEVARPEKRPIVVYGPQPVSGFAIGDDNIWRFRTYEVMVICPTHHHLALFRTELNLLTGGLFHEETQEYQYAHVVSVSTVTLPPSNLSLEETRKDKDSADHVRFARTVLKQFELGVSSGRSSTVTVGISDANNPENEARLPDSGIQQIISSVRRVLRDKKGAFG
jgi:hypothetical protein